MFGFSLLESSHCDKVTSVLFAVVSEMTLLSSQPKPSEPTSDATPTAGMGSEDPELRMLEKRAKVIEELLQTEKDYIKDLQMCVEEIIEPLQKKQVRCCKGPVFTSYTIRQLVSSHDTRYRMCM